MVAAVPWPTPKGNPSWHDTEDQRLDLAALVVATVPLAAIEAEAKQYRVRVGDEIITRRRAFGVEETHLQFLQWCQEPHAIADLAVRLGLERPAAAPADDDLTELVEEMDGPPGLPLREARAIVQDLYSKQLAQILEPADLNDPRLYQGLLTGIRQLGVAAAASGEAERAGCSRSETPRPQPAPDLVANAGNRRGRRWRRSPRRRRDANR